MQFAKLIKENKDFVSVINLVEKTYNSEKLSWVNCTESEILHYTETDVFQESTADRAETVEERMNELQNNGYIIKEKF